MELAIIADDNTGATDSAGMLTERGMRTLLFTEFPEERSFFRVTQPFHACVFGTQTRSLPKDKAYQKTSNIVTILNNHNVPRIQLKYCSTFDSTPKGNIGPSLDAAMDVLKNQATIVCPALPINGRTTYYGYHFVQGTLLSESALRNHPLNPMTDANLVRWLQYQTSRKVGLIDVYTIRQGPSTIQKKLVEGTESGISYFVCDALEVSDIHSIAEATKEHRLTSGGSGISAELASVIFPQANRLTYQKRIETINKKTMVLSGSCSPKALKQLETAQEKGFFILSLNTQEILDNTLDIHSLIDQAIYALSKNTPIALSVSTVPEEVKKTQEYGKSIGLSVEQIGETISNTLANMGKKVQENTHLGRIIVAGGETSGAVCRTFDWKMLEVGLPLDPGVPYCFSQEDEHLVVLKSGNFGKEDLYPRVRSL